jgi:hypothetical protein
MRLDRASTAETHASFTGVHSRAHAVWVSPRKANQRRPDSPSKAVFWDEAALNQHRRSSSPGSGSRMQAHARRQLRDHQRGRWLA